MVSIEKVTGVFLKYGITANQLAVLDQLLREPTLSIHAISLRIGLRASSVTASVDSLVNRDFLTKAEEPPVPPAPHVLTITPKGQKLLAAIQKELDVDVAPKRVYQSPGSDDWKR